MKAQGINVLFETDSSGNITAEYVYDPDGMPLIMTKNGQNYYYVYNINKEITSLTNASGDVVATYTYDAWGNILSQSGTMATDNPLRYKGYRFDEETGLYYLIARYYQPAEGVFLTADPEGGDTEDAKTQNGYNYANNNPVMMTDPDGNFAWLAINAGFAAYDGYKAYKSGKASGKKGWALAGSVAWASGSSFAKVGHLKKAGKALRFINGTRRTGVNRAWKEERAMIAKTGQGTRKWSGKRRREILEYGSAKGMIGHHVNSVKNYPHLAGRANNVRFVSKKQHYRLHGGNWRNQTTGRFINRR